MAKKGGTIEGMIKNPQIPGGANMNKQSKQYTKKIYLCKKRCG